MSNWSTTSKITELDRVSPATARDGNAGGAAGRGDRILRVTMGVGTLQIPL